MGGALGDIARSEPDPAIGEEAGKATSSSCRSGLIGDWFAKPRWLGETDLVPLAGIEPARP